MNRTREYRIAVRKKKIKQRKKKIFDITDSPHRSYSTRIQKALYGDHEGLFNKWHYGTLTNGVKTKTKNVYITHRHKCGYGKACVYSNHDKRQLLHIQQEIYDYKSDGDSPTADYERTLFYE